MVSISPELKRRSKSFGDLTCKRTFDYYQNEPYSMTTTVNDKTHSTLLQRRYSSCVENHGFSSIMLYDWIENAKLDYSKGRPTTATLHESKSADTRHQNGGDDDKKRRSGKGIPTHHTWHSYLDHQHHQSKDIVSAIMEAAYYPENKSLGWVGVEVPDALAIPPCRPPSPPPPPPPIENDTHIFDLLSMDQVDSYFMHYSQRTDRSPCMNSVTVEKLVEILTKEIDSDLTMNFFLTFRQFLTPIKLCKLLILRFRWALLEETDERRLVRIRTFVVLRYWLTHYWDHDFVNSRTLRFMLCTFLSQLRTHPVILASPRDARIIKYLRNLLKRQRKLFGNTDSTTCVESCTKQQNAIQQDDHAAPKSARRRHDYSTPLSSSSSSTITTSTSSPLRPGHGDHWVKLLGRQQQQQQRKPQKELRSSISTPFLGRTRRLSTCSQRSVHEENAWTAKMNFGIKTIKRTVPSVYHTLVHGMTNNNNNHQQHIPNNKCTCKQHSTYGHYLQHRYPKSTIMRSASRMFDQKSSSPPSTYRHDDFDILSTSSHTNTTCPYYTPSPHHHRVSYYSDGSGPSSSTCSTCSQPDDSHYKPFILTYRSEIIAQQFCMMEQVMLQQVTWDELTELRWRKRSKGTVISPETDQGLLQDGVEQLIGFFNKTCQWVASEIVRTRSMDLRIQVIEKFIRIALKCYHHRNYSTLMQILLGLQAPAVSRLERSWHRIDPYEKQIFNELKEMAKPFRNWKNVRDAMSKAVEDIAESPAVESVLINKSESIHRRGCIPFLGLYLSDLVFNAELPTFIDAKTLQHRQMPVLDNAQDQELCKRLGSHFVNYNKFKITASIIKHILAFQVLSRSYQFIPHTQVLYCLDKMKLLDGTEIRKQSGLCEPDTN
ncbi:ras guanine nucleotide exchange factor domain-containing protein [Chlamydoabsidia padenii]|nr:ras guanine nucleotide exchange factor domain-containing protein [Chlamydoabsidia padenii]